MLVFLAKISELRSDNTAVIALNKIYSSFGGLAKDIVLNSKHSIVFTAESKQSEVLRTMVEEDYFGLLLIWHVQLFRV